MEMTGFEHCTSEGQLWLGLTVLCKGQTGVIEWNEAYRSDYYTGLHPLTANEPFKVVFKNGDTFYPYFAANDGAFFHVESLPFRVGSRVFWTADGETVKVEIAKDEDGYFVICDDDRGACINRWRFLGEMEKYVSSVIKK